MATVLAALSSAVFAQAPRSPGASARSELRVAVEVEEDVYRYTPANNGAGPMWCSGSTCLVRIGDDIFASGLDTIADAKPLNNCRWTIHKRDPNGWTLQQADPVGRTREPCPLATLAPDMLLLSANPTLVIDRTVHAGPARPEILQWSARAIDKPPQKPLPQWQGQPPFSEHSYRSFAADSSGGGLVLFQNIGYTHAEWAWRDGDGRWASAGRLVWPWGAEYDKPQPIRLCYPNVAVRGREVHFCGVSDIVEPYEKWRAHKQKLTGRQWDYEFRRLFYTWSRDIRTGKFEPWVEVASRDKTCGWITPGDLHVSADGVVHLLWTERAIDTRLRKDFFPDQKQAYALCYARLREGKVVTRRELLRAEEGGPAEIPERGRFHVLPDGRLLAFFYVRGHDPAGKSVSENRLIELTGDGPPGPAVRVPLKYPMSDCFTATPRAGCQPSNLLDLLGPRVGSNNTISYARVRVK